MKRTIAPAGAGRDQLPVVPAKAPGFWPWVRWGAVGLLGLGGIGAVVQSLVAAPDETAHLQFLVGFGLIGASAALAQARGRWPGLLGEWFAGLRRGQFVALTIGAGAALAGLLYWCGMRQFGGYDHSGIIDAGWRLAQGQRPYRDFPCTLPPAFVLGAGYAFRVFGLSWRALIMFTAIFSVGMFFWLMWLAVRLFADRALALILALTVQSLSMLLFSYWWYNPITSVSAAVFLLSATLLWHRPAHWSARWSYLAALALLATMKPNMAGGCIILVSTVLFCSRERRWPAVFLSAGAFALFLLFLWVNHITLPNLLNAYLSVRQYGATISEVTGLFLDMSPGELWLSLLAAVASLLPAILCAWRLRSRSLAHWPWIGIGGILAAVHPFLINGEFKLVDLVPALIGSVLVAGELSNNQLNGAPLVLGGSIRRTIMALFLVLGFTGTGLAIARDRVKSIGPTEFFEYAMEPGTVPDGFFRGLHTGPAFREVLDQVQAAVRDKPDTSVFFGPRMEWAYAAFRKASPIGLPIMWAPGAFFTRADVGTYFGAFVQKRFDLLVFLRAWDATGYYPPQLFAVLRRYYICDQRYWRLMVGRRGQSASALASADPGKWADFLMPSLRLTWEADLHLQRGETAQALVLLDTAIRQKRGALHPLNLMAWIRATAVEPEFRNGAEAVFYAEQACKEGGYKDAAFMGTLAAAYAEVGRFDEAVAMAARSRDLALLTGDTELEAANEGALRLFQAHQPFRDKRPQVARHCRLAEARVQHGEAPAAVAELQQALDLDPDSPFALNALAWIRATAAEPELRNGAEAVRLAERACKLTQSQDGALLRTLAVAYAEVGRFDDAAATAARACELAQRDGDKDRAAMDGELKRLFQAHVRFPDRAASALTHCRLADTHIQRGEMPAAAAELQEALTLDPNEPLALNNLAWIRATAAAPELRNGIEAVRLAEQACKATQYKDPGAVGTLAAAYAEAGRFDEAVATAARARELALAAGQQERAAKNEECARLFKAHLPYHDKATQPGSR